ncbi:MULTISPECIES: hypothetical protein [Streptomyces]|nr:hypothetical protein [Streptomyces sp. S501]
MPVGTAGDECPYSASRRLSAYAVSLLPRPACAPFHPWPAKKAALASTN